MIHCYSSSFPLRFVKMAQEAPRVVSETRQKIILGVDRLDYTKGLVHRLKAFELLLQKYPEYIEKALYIISVLMVPHVDDIIILAMRYNL